VLDRAADFTPAWETIMNDLVTYVRIRLNAMAKTERGASAVEYGLLVALIAIIIIVAVTLLGSNLNSIFNKTANSIGS
jgi:pilus assembly protein Flp/PilA